MVSAKNYSLQPHNTFGIEAKANLFIDYNNLEELKLLIEARKFYDYNYNFIHIGEGSNLLFTRDFDGIVLHSSMNKYSVLEESDEKITFRVENGVKWDAFCEDMARKGYWGVENLSYIPGEVGAAAVQNIGAYGVEIKDVIESIEVISVFSGKQFTMTRGECEYCYRDSVFKHMKLDKYVVLAVNIELSKKPYRQLEYGNLSSLLTEESGLLEIRKAVGEVRKSKLPDVSEFGSAGSFFKNPMICGEQFDELQREFPDVPHYMGEGKMKIPAAWLIDKSGLKGKRCGAAMVYEKQPLVIVNTGGATAHDIMDLATFVVNEVYKNFYIELIPEVTYVE